MPRFEIYQLGKKIGTKDFRGAFYVIKEIDSDELRWEADEEGAASGGGVIHIWVQTLSTTGIVQRQISFVRPDWQLIIDGTAMEHKFYQYVDVTGKTVELQYNDYRFVCSLAQNGFTDPTG